VLESTPTMSGQTVNRVLRTSTQRKDPFSVSLAMVER
jgi:hypothetical protein